MRYLLFTYLLVLSLSATSQVTVIKPSTTNVPIEVDSKANRITEFWGVPFGVSADSAKRVVREKHGLQPTPETTRDRIVYKPTSFAGEETDIVVISISNRVVSFGYVSFSPRRESQILDLYKRLKDKLVNKYGDPDKDVESYKYPYRKGDGHEALAISTGRATIGAIWEFSDPGTSKGRIVLSVDDRMYVALYYEDGIYSKMAEMKRQEKESDDL